MAGFSFQSRLLYYQELYSVRKSTKANPYGNHIANRYDAGGQKLSTEYLTLKTPLSVPLSQGEVRSWVYNSTLMSSSGQAYVGNMEYGRVKNNNGSFWTGLNKIHHTEGYVTQYPNGGYVAPNYHYYRKDHLGNIREVWLAPFVVYVANNIVNPASTVQRTQYYPSGLPWSEGYNPSTQQRKYNGKEWIEAHGLDEYYSFARNYYPAIMRTTTMDPLAEKYYHISPYAWCGNNPVKFVDPYGMDYWSTDNPDQIRAFFEAYKAGNVSKSTYENWTHISDKELMEFKGEGNLTLNDVTRTFYSSQSGLVNGVFTVTGKSWKVEGSKELSDWVEIGVGGFSTATAIREGIEMEYIHQYRLSKGAAPLAKPIGTTLRTIRLVGKATGVLSASISIYEAFKNPTTGNIIQAGANMGLVLLRVNPIVGIGLGIMDVSGASDYLYDTLGGFVDNSISK